MIHNNNNNNNSALTECFPLHRVCLVGWDYHHPEVALEKRTQSVWKCHYFTRHRSSFGSDTSWSSMCLFQQWGQLASCHSLFSCNSIVFCLCVLSWPGSFTGQIPVVWIRISFCCSVWFCHSRMRRNRTVLRTLSLRSFKCLVLSW